MTISGIASDSRLAAPGALFVCLRRRYRHGSEFAAYAVARGAAAIHCEPGGARRAPGPAVLEADDPLAALGDIGRLVRGAGRGRRRLCRQDLD